MSSVAHSQLASRAPTKVKHRSRFLWFFRLPSFSKSKRHALQPTSVVPPSPGGVIPITSYTTTVAVQQPQNQNYWPTGQHPQSPHYCVRRYSTADNSNYSYVQTTSTVPHRQNDRTFTRDSYTFAVTQSGGNHTSLTQNNSAFVAAGNAINFGGQKMQI